jgi:uncharacterized protein (DUF1501 family)
VRCIECEEIELARVRDQRAGQTLPIPYAALDGFPAGRRATDLTRRKLLQWGVAGFASIYAAQELGWEQVWASVAEAAEAPPDSQLVLLYLAGGNDGLNIVLPNGRGSTEAQTNYSAYVDARGDLHRGIGQTPAGTGQRTGSWALDGFGMAKDLAFTNSVVSTAGEGDNGDASYGFDTLYGDGQANSRLAVMPAVDALKYSLSHFDNADVWFEASHDLNTKTGWLGRWIDRYGSPSNPLQAISIDTALSKAIRTAVNPVCAISSVPMNGFKLNGGSATNPATAGGSGSTDLNLAMNSLAAVPAGAANAYLQRSRATYGLAYNTWDQVKSLGALPGTPAQNGYPNNNTLSTRLRTAAQLLKAPLGTRVITIHWGGFDTHTNQLTNQDKQFKELSRALAAFQRDIETPTTPGGQAIADRVTVLVFSEFGRRVKETPNTAPDKADAGTDHGAGGLMFALGNKVKGGLASEWPGCRPADLVPAGTNAPPTNTFNAQGNLRVKTDFRSVYLSVLQDWLGDPAGDALSLLGHTTKDPVLPLVRGDGQAGALFR